MIPKRRTRWRDRESPAELVARLQAKAKREALEELLAFQIRAHRLPLGEAQFEPFPDRKWRVDRAWPEFRVAVEVEGLTREGGRHQRIEGFTSDAEKSNRLALEGWTLLRVTRAHIQAGYAVKWIRDALEAASRRGGRS